MTRDETDRDPRSKGVDALDADELPMSGDRGRSSAAEDAPDHPLPERLLQAVEHYTRQARDTDDERAARRLRERRDERLARHGYVARVREEPTRAVLVCHPATWTEDGTVYPDRIEDLDRAVEIPLSGPGDPEDWDEIDAHNGALAAAVRERHGEVHGATARALADFASNHYAKPIEALAVGELAEFREEYFVRNAWPSDAQREVLSRSLELVFECADSPMPGVGESEKR